MNISFRQKTLALLLLAGIISSTGCQAASDLFNRDTYVRSSSEPWEKNIQRKPVKPKNALDEL